jgi:hypothetical protein
LILVDTVPALGLLKSVAVLRLSVVIKEAYGIGILHIWYLSIGIHFILLSVKFEDGLSIQLRKKGNLQQRFTTGNRKVSKKSQAARPPFFTPRLFQTLLIGQDLAHLPVRAS